MLFIPCMRSGHLIFWSLSQCSLLSLFLYFSCCCCFFGVFELKMENSPSFNNLISFSLSLFFYIGNHNFLVSSHFYATASHAIGSYSAVSSRTNTPNPYFGQQQQQQVQQQLSQQQINRNDDFAGIKCSLFQSMSDS